MPLSGPQAKQVKVTDNQLFCLIYTLCLQNDVIPIHILMICACQIILRFNLQRRGQSKTGDSGTPMANVLEVS